MLTGCEYGFHQHAVPLQDHFFLQRTEENLNKAIEFFQSAINEDPGYAPAYVGLADCYNSLGTAQFSAFPPIEGRQRGFLLENARRYNEAIEQLRNVIAMDPSHWLEKAYEERSNYLAYLKVFPIVDPLRSDPRFTDLVLRIGLPD